MTYNDFLHTKIEVAPVSGFEVRPEAINPALKPHQQDADMEQPSLFDLIEQEIV